MAYDAIEMPEPFRSDWRFAFGVYVMIKMLGKDTKQLSIGEVYKTMRGLYDSLPEQQDEKQIELNLNAWLPLIGGRQIRGPGGNPTEEYELEGEFDSVGYDGFK